MKKNKKEFKSIFDKTNEQIEQEKNIPNEKKPTSLLKKIFFVMEDLLFLTLFGVFMLLLIFCGAPQNNREEKNE